KRYIQKNQLPHLLFHGPPGTGKTSTILALAKILYGIKSKAFVLELNASDDRGISTVREQIKTFSEAKSSFGFSDLVAEPLRSSSDPSLPLNGNSASISPHISTKLIILDEADQMTSSAQNALRRIMEQYSKNVRFCLICNSVNKINPAIKSRCTGFRFAPLGKEAVSFHTMDFYSSKGDIG
ncbi:putative replication factor C, subunit 5, partial [Cardiosporidium cionae]